MQKSQEEDQIKKIEKSSQLKTMLAKEKYRSLLKKGEAGRVMEFMKSEQQSSQLMKQLQHRKTNMEVKQLREEIQLK